MGRTNDQKIAGAHPAAGNEQAGLFGILPVRFPKCAGGPGC